MRSLRHDLLVLTIAMLPTLALANEAPEIHLFQQPHMGCLFSFKLVSDDAVAAKKAADAAFARVAELDRAFSDYKEDSELSKLGQTAGSGETVKLSNDLCRVLAASERFWKWSDGTFDVTLGRCTKLWRETRKSRMLPDPSLLKEALGTVGFEKLGFSEQDSTASITTPGVRLDLGGIGKGFALDEAANVLKATFHIENFLLDAGGQIAAIGNPPGRESWGVAIEKLPSENPDEPTTVVHLKNRHLATSGDLHQVAIVEGKHYSHILDPKTGLGMTQTVQASVIANDGTTADAVAKGMLLLPEAVAKEKLKLLPGVEALALRLDDNGNVVRWKSDGWGK